MTSRQRTISGWGRQPVLSMDVAEPAGAADVSRLVRADGQCGVIPRGLGRAYGDSALNAGGLVATCRRLDRFRGFDAATGTLEVEAGVSFQEIIETFLPRGWFLPTTPGTKFVTVGGAIAADVHGKNHHRRRSLGQFVDSLSIVIGDGSVVTCSRDERPDLFFATLGGMGLTGIILAATLRLVPVETSRVTVEYRKTRDLDHTLENFEAHDETCEHSVGWIDCMARGPSMGRSVVMQANWTGLDELRGASRAGALALPRKLQKTVPFTPPVSLLSPLSVRVFNQVFYAIHKDGVRIVDLDTFFYPLDAVSHWNRLYGPRGFVQYQAFFPRATSRRGLRALLECVVQSGAASFLAVVKSCGEADGGLLSYLEPGHTLALDIPYRVGAVDDLCRRCDRIVLEHGGRLYLAKDALMDAATFRAMYPRLDEFLDVKRRYDPSGRFTSSQARRLAIA